MKGQRFINKAVRIIRPISVNIKWFIFSKLPLWKGVTKQKINNIDFIISLTSFPARINAVIQTIKSLMLQKKKANKIILWLVDSEFENIKLPEKLLKLKKYGLEIKWCDNMRSYNKLIPALELYPEAIIYTADDDIYYSSSSTKILLSAYVQNPKIIYAHRVTKFFLSDNKWENIGGGWDIWSGPSYLNKLTGVGGVLYPPHSLYKDILEKDIFLDICKTNDDIWFWFMATLNHVKICVPPKAQPLLVYVGKTQDGPTLNSINDKGEKLFDIQFNNMVNRYPEVDTLMRNEIKERT